jgi:capsular exopolysaccharide synthesis family protein
MVSNASEAEAKTGIAANLAVAYAQQGKPVRLLDGDLRHPHLHSLFGLPNQNGLANIVNGSQHMADIGEPVENVEGLTLVPSGVAAGDSTGWMDATKWAPALSRLAQHSHLVIVDSPSPETADAQTLASTVDGVLLVIRAGQTPAEEALATLRRFQLVGAKVLGTVLYHAPHQQPVDAQILSWAKGKLSKKEDHSAVASKIEDAPIQPSS